jgi:hypothetical protein
MPYSWKSDLYRDPTRWIMDFGTLAFLTLLVIAALIYLWFFNE